MTATMGRSRTETAELFTWIIDHNSGVSPKGFKLLILRWSDGVGFLPLHFILCSSGKVAKRLQDIRKIFDKRTCGYKRRLKAITKTTNHLEVMMKKL